MTSKEELLKLQQSAHTSGVLCDFSYDENGYISEVFYLGTWYSPITFAEKARTRFAPCTKGD